MSVKRIFWQDASAGNWCKWFGRKWVVQRLVNRGAISFAWCAIGCRKVNSCEARLIDRTTVVRGDVCDQQLLERVLGEYEFDTVLHLAAQSIRHHSKPKIRFLTFETNIGGTWALLEACRRSRELSKLSLPHRQSLRETTRSCLTTKRPRLWRTSLRTSASLAPILSRTIIAVTYGLPVVITRCGNFYGGGDLNWNRMCLAQSIGNSQSTTSDSLDGNYVRDYFYVEDGAEVYLLLAEKLASTPELRRIRRLIFQTSCKSALRK
jgi:CDP-glucose 4,6-dehydratase